MSFQKYWLLFCASATRFIEYSHAQRRIRTCECGFKFTTYERIETDKQDLGKSGKEKKKDFIKDTQGLSPEQFEDLKKQKVPKEILASYSKS